MNTLLLLTSGYFLTLAILNITYKKKLKSSKIKIINNLSSRKEAEYLNMEEEGIQIIKQNFDFGKNSWLVITEKNSWQTTQLNVGKNYYVRRTLKKSKWLQFLPLAKIYFSIYDIYLLNENKKAYLIFSFNLSQFKFLIIPGVIKIINKYMFRIVLSIIVITFVTSR